MTTTSISSRGVLVGTGNQALDRVLGGGLPQGSLTILAGAPGTGKTVVAQQTIFNNAAAGGRSLYLTTYSEPLSKLIHYLERFGFYNSERMFSSVVYRDLGKRLRTEGVGSLAQIIAELIDESRCSVLVIDSFKALHDLTGGTDAFRLSIFDTAAHLSAAGITTLWLGEYAPADVEQLPEFAVADGIVQFANRAHGVRDERTLRVLKMRGAATLPGEHTFNITSAGIEVFPRLVGADADAGPGPAPERFSSGVEGLDALLDGGLWRGTSTIVLGPSGSGKTMLGITFLAAGARAGEPGLLLTLQEDRRVLGHILAGIDGTAARDLIAIDHRSPLEADLVDIVVSLKSQILSGSVKRLVIDALGDLKDAAIDPSRLRAMIYNLVRFCAEHGVTVFINAETGAGDRDHSAISSISDNVLLLRWAADRFDSTLTVVKTRRSQHDPRAHAVMISARGFAVGDALTTGPTEAD